MNNSDSNLLSAIEDELTGVIALYDQLVEQSDKLAAAMHYKTDFVLGKVMPTSKTERRDSSRIRKWFDECRNDLLEHITEIEAANAKRDEREKLLASLNLTEEQKALLFEN
jgi:hypothetical protein